MAVEEFLMTDPERLVKIWSPKYKWCFSIEDFQVCLTERYSLTTQLCWTRDNSDAPASVSCASLRTACDSHTVHLICCLQFDAMQQIKADKTIFFFSQFILTYFTFIFRLAHQLPFRFFDGIHVHDSSYIVFVQGQIMRQFTVSSL